MSNPILPGSKYGSPGRKRAFRWTHILYRAVWNVTWLLLARWTPPQMYGWRRLLLILFGAKIDPTARVYNSAEIWYPPNLEMAKHSVLGWCTHCYCMDKIIIEDYAIVSQFVHLVAGTHDPHSETFQLQTKPIRICSHAWLAAGCFVGPGVTVGEGALLGARAVTFKDLEPWTMYIGNPAVKLKPRRNFTDEAAD